jgi:hypothetical protein
MSVSQHSIESRSMSLLELGVGRSGCFQPSRVERKCAEKSDPMMRTP